MEAVEETTVSLTDPQIDLITWLDLDTFEAVEATWANGTDVRCEIEEKIADAVRNDVDRRCNKAGIVVEWVPVGGRAFRSNGSPGPADDHYWALRAQDGLPESEIPSGVLKAISILDDVICSGQSFNPDQIARRVLAATEGYGS